MDIVTETPESELLQALQAALDNLPAGENEPGTITSTEFAAALGMSKPAGQTRMKRLMAAGVVAPAMVRRTNAWNISRLVQGYRLVK